VGNLRIFYTLEVCAYNAYNIVRRFKMKRRDLIRKLEKNGWKLARHGADHDIYTNGIKSQPVPRHNEINEITAKNILKKAGLR